MKPINTTNVSSPKAQADVTAGRKQILPGRQLLFRQFNWLTRKPLLVGVGLVVIIFGFLAWRSIARQNVLAKDPVPLPVVTVTVEKAQLRPNVQHLMVTGSISPWDQLSIGAEVNGLKIESVKVEEGELVKKGQVLATLNPSIVKASLAEARARLEAGYANLKKAIQPNRPEDILAWKAALAQTEAAMAQEEANLVEAQANLSNARQNAKRYAELVKQGAVSAQDAENRDTQAKTAEAEVKAAEQKIRAAKFAAEQNRNRLAMAEMGGRREDIQVSQASLAELKATVERLEAQLAQTVIRAPEDGLIMRRDAHIGEITTVNKPLFLIARANRLELRAQVPEADLAKVVAGQSVRLFSTGESGFASVGKVREVSPLVDTNSRLGTVRIDVPELSGYKVGMFVRGDIDVGLTKSISIPAKAVLNSRNQPFVFVLKGNRAWARLVRTGTRNGDFQQLISGLVVGEPVIVDGAGFLKDGDLVRIAP